MQRVVLDVFIECVLVGFNESSVNSFFGYLERQFWPALDKLLGFFRRQQRRNEVTNLLLDLKLKVPADNLPFKVAQQIMKDHLLFLNQESNVNEQLNP